MSEIIVEFPSKLTAREKKMIYGYNGELIRCKDCEHYDESGWGFGECHLERWGDGWANYPPPSVSEDGFCKWAKRKEE